MARFIYQTFNTVTGERLTFGDISRATKHLRETYGVVFPARSVGLTKEGTIKYLELRGKSDAATRAILSPLEDKYVMVGLSRHKVM